MFIPQVTSAPVNPRTVDHRQVARCDWSCTQNQKCIQLNMILLTFSERISFGLAVQHYVQSGWATIIYRHSTLFLVIITTAIKYINHALTVVSICMNKQKL